MGSVLSCLFDSQQTPSPLSPQPFSLITVRLLCICFPLVFGVEP
jgi:hypothetical protein